MAASNETEIMEIKQEPPSPEPVEELSYCEDDAPSSPSNANLSSEHDDLPPASDFLSVLIKEEPPPSPPSKDSPFGDPTPYELHADPVPVSCMVAANRATLDEEMVEAILPDRGPGSPSPELTFEMTAMVKQEMDWDSTDAARQSAENHNVPVNVKEEPVDWESSNATAEGQGSSTDEARTAIPGKSAAQPRCSLKRKQGGSGAEIVGTKQLLTDANGSPSTDINKIKEKIKQRMEYHQTKTCLEYRIEALENEKAKFEAKIKANTKASKLDQLLADADRGVVKAKFLLDQLRCYGKGTYDWSDETLNVCKQWAKKFPQDYKQCSVDFLTLPTLSEMGIKAEDSVYEGGAGPNDDDIAEDSEGSD